MPCLGSRLDRHARGIVVWSIISIITIGVVGVHLLDQCVSQRIDAVVVVPIARLDDNVVHACDVTTISGRRGGLGFSARRGLSR